MSAGPSFLALKRRCLALIRQESAQAFEAEA